MAMIKRFALMFLALCAFATPAHAQVQVVASFSVLADIVRQIGGEKVEVKSLVPPNGDAHEYQAKPSDAKALKEAKVIFVNGLGLEGWMERLITQSGTTAPVITVNTGVTPRKMEEGGKEVLDPHSWQSIPNVMLHYIPAIRDALIAADKTNEAYYTSQADKYRLTLRTLDAWARATLGFIPIEQRKIITNHDALGYFGAEYGVTIFAAQGLQPDAEPSAGQMANLVKQIKAGDVKTVFIENMSSPRLMQRLEKQTGATFGGELYTDATGDKAPVDSYEGMMRWNVTAISDALKKQADKGGQGQGATPAAVKAPANAEKAK